MVAYDEEDSAQAFLGAVEPGEDEVVDVDFVLQLDELMRMFRSETVDQHDWTFEKFMYFVAELSGSTLDEDRPQAE